MAAKGPNGGVEGGMEFLNSSLPQRIDAQREGELKSNEAIATYNRADLRGVFSGSVGVLADAQTRALIEEDGPLEIPELAPSDEEDAPDAAMRRTGDIDTDDILWFEAGEAEDIEALAAKNSQVDNLMKQVESNNRDLRNFHNGFLQDVWNWMQKKLEVRSLTRAELILSAFLWACGGGGEQPTEPVDAGTPVPTYDSGPPAPAEPDAGFIQIGTDGGIPPPPDSGVKTDAAADGGVREDAHVADTGMGNPDAMTPPPMPDMPQVAQSLIEIGPNDRVFQAEIIVGQNTDTITLVGPDGFYQNVSVQSGSRVTVSIPEAARPNPVQLEGNWRVHACNGGEGGQCTVSAAHFTVDRYQLPATPTVDQAEVVMGPNMPEREINITVADPANTTEIRVAKDGVPMPAVPVVPGQTTYPFTIRMANGAGMYEFRAACHGGRAISANAAQVEAEVDMVGPPAPTIVEPILQEGEGFDPGGPNFTIRIQSSNDTVRMEVRDFTYYLDLQGNRVITRDTGFINDSRLARQLGSNEWVFTENALRPNDDHNYIFRPIDQAENPGTESDEIAVAWGQ